MGVSCLPTSCRPR